MIAGASLVVCWHGSRIGQGFPWLCARHGPYPMKIRFRVINGQGCREDAKESVREKRRVTLNARSRDRYALAAKVRKERAQKVTAPPLEVQTAPCPHAPLRASD
jgi:hypothetical protein